MFKVKNIFLLSLIFFFLPACVLYLGQSSFIRLFNIILPVTLLFAIIIKPDAYFRNMEFLFKRAPMVYLLIFLGWCIFVSLLAVMNGYYSITSFFVYCIIQLFFRIFVVYSFPIIAIPSFFNLKYLIKIFFAAYIIIFILGIVEFISAVFHLEFITNIIHIISNIISDEKAIVISGESNLARVRSVFDEPGGLGQFIAINMPIIYTLAREKYKIFNNNLLNVLTQKTIIPLMLINLLLTQSPIYIVISTIITIAFYFREIKKLLYKHKFIIIFVFLFILFTLLFLQSFIDIEKTPLIRIIKVLSIFNNFSIEKLISADYSLATRIINYANQFIIFLNYPIFGIGFGNNEHILIHYLNNSPLTLTQEICLKIATTNRILINSNVMYLLLHQTGLIGYLLYVIFMIKTINICKKYKNYFIDIEQAFIESLQKTLICILIISSVYNITIFHQYLWFYAGLSCSILIIFKHKRYFIDRRHGCEK